MESLPENPVLKFNPNVIQDIRMIFNVHQPGVMAEILDSFEAWINKQNHIIKKDFPRNYLESFVIICKGSLERSKIALDKLCTMKTLMADFFKIYDVKEIPDTTHFVLPMIMPMPTKDNYRVIYTYFLSSDFEAPLLYEFYRYIMLTMEYIKMHDYYQGLVAIFDCRDINVLALTMKINVIQLRDIISILLNGYAMRLKGIHVISSSKTVDAFVAIIKQVVSSKIATRIQVQKTIEELYEHVAQELLPIECGGMAGPMRSIYNQWFTELSTQKNIDFLKDICQSRTNEAYRQTDKYNEQILGMPGSFRSLKVD